MRAHGVVYLRSPYPCNRKIGQFNCINVTEIVYQENITSCLAGPHWGQSLVPGTHKHAKVVHKGLCLTVETVCPTLVPVHHHGITSLRPCALIASAMYGVF